MWCLPPPQVESHPVQLETCWSDRSSALGFPPCSFKKLVSKAATLPNAQQLPHVGPWLRTGVTSPKSRLSYLAGSARLTVPPLSAAPPPFASSSAAIFATSSLVGGMNPVTCATGLFITSV